MGGDPKKIIPTHRGTELLTLKWFVRPYSQAKPPTLSPVSIRRTEALTLKWFDALTVRLSKEE